MKKTAKKLITGLSITAITVGALSLSGCTKEYIVDPTSTLPNDQVMQLEMPSNGDKVALINTNLGTIKVKLFHEHAPETVKNFETLSSEGKYEGVVFHRVIKDFMIQTGDFENGNGTGGHSYKGPGTMFEDEFHNDLSHYRGALSMANRGPATNGSQFFIVHAEATPHLNGKHSVFGQTYDGFDVLDAIANVETGGADRPYDDIVIETIEIIEFSHKG